jgi:hypothetical protein
VFARWIPREEKRVDNGFDTIWERKKEPGKRFKGPKSISLGYSSKDASEEKMGKGIFFSSAKREERLRMRDGDDGF